MIYLLSDTADFYWQNAKLESWHWGLVIYNQIVTWTAFAILAMFTLCPIVIALDSHRIVIGSHRRSLKVDSRPILGLFSLYRAKCRTGWNWVGWLSKVVGTLRAPSVLIRPWLVNLATWNIRQSQVYLLLQRSNRYMNEVKCAKDVCQCRIHTKSFSTWRASKYITKQSNALHVILLLIADVTIMRSQLGINRN